MYVKFLSILSFSHGNPFFNAVSEYNDTLKQCCRDGMVENFLGYTCERRSEYITDEAECRKAFLHCCQKLADVKKEAIQGELHFARSKFHFPFFLLASNLLQCIF